VTFPWIQRKRLKSISLSIADAAFPLRLFLCALFLDLSPASWPAFYDACRCNFHLLCLSSPRIPACRVFSLPYLSVYFPDGLIYSTPRLPTVYCSSKGHNPPKTPAVIISLFFQAVELSNWLRKVWHKNCSSVASV